MDVGQHSSISEHINFTDCPTESICLIFPLSLVYYTSCLLERLQDFIILAFDLQSSVQFVLRVDWHVILCTNPVIL